MQTSARNQQLNATANVSDVFKISAVIPTHNRATLVIRAISSVLQQTYPVQEIIVVDDGSTDDTKELLCRFLSSLASTAASIRYHYQEQQGAAVARNTGIAAASGEWIAFLDSDDIWLPQKLEWQVKALQRYSGVALACVTDSRYVNNPVLNKTAFAQIGDRYESPMGIIPRYARRITSHRFHGAHLPTLMVHRTLIQSLGGFHTAFPVNEDTDFFFKLAQQTDVCYVNLPLIEIDRTPKRTIGLTELREKENYRCQMAQLMYEKWLHEYHGQDQAIPKEICHRLHDVHVGWASWYLVAGDTQKALDSASVAFHYQRSAKAAAKWMLIKFAPGLIRKELVRRRTKAPPPLL
jgi:glycosyltransferase involved in cell wall biosynthesis